MRLATWNVNWMFNMPQHRRQPILDALRRVRADVVCLQEVPADTRENLAAWLAKSLGMTCAWAPTSRPEVWRHLMDDAVSADSQAGVAILSRWPLEDVTPIDLPGPQARTAVAAVVRGPSGDFGLVTAHLNAGLRNSGARCDQVRILAELAAAKRTKEHPTIVAGDLNAVDASEEVRLLTGMTREVMPIQLVDAWRFRSGAGATVRRRNPWLGAGPEPDMRLDYILIEPRWDSAAGLVRQIRLFGRPTPGLHRVWPSDHLGVVATLTNRG